MEKKLKLNWSIYHNELDSETRYCHNCGSKVLFKDSLKRRQNANGKNIFYFAIYKCPKGHTWNKQITSFKTMAGLINTHQTHHPIESEYQELNLSLLIESGINEVEILLEAFQQKMRLDKFISSKIQDISRSSVVKLINEGLIRLNGASAAGSVTLKDNDIITLSVAGMNERFHTSSQTIRMS